MAIWATIEVYGAKYHGRVFPHGRGAFKWVDGDERYTGEFRDGKSEGYGAHAWAGATRSGKWADGVCDGHFVYRWANGDVDYYLQDRGSVLHTAIEYTNGACAFDRQPCDPTPTSVAS